MICVEGRVAKSYSLEGNSHSGYLKTAQSYNLKIPLLGDYPKVTGRPVRMFTGQKKKVAKPDDMSWIYVVA